MSGSAEPGAQLESAEEEALFQAALAALAAGNRAAARHWFEAVVELAGRRQAEARGYLEKIGRREIFYKAAPARRSGRPGDGADAGPPATDAAPPDFGLPPPGPPMPGDDFEMAPLDADLFESVRASPSLKSVIAADSPAVAAPSTEPLRRTPHMSLTPEDPPVPGAALAVSIWADAGPFLAGEQGEEVVVDYAGDEIRLEVWLVASEHFAIEGPDAQPLVLRRAEARSLAALFTVRVRHLAAPAAPAGAFLSALFAYRGRPCGRVTRAMKLAPPRQPADSVRSAAAVAVPGPAPAAAAPSIEPAALRIETAAEPADLIVRVVAGSLSDGRVFECRVQTRLLSAYAAGASESWRLADLAPDVVAAYMKQVTAKGLSDQVRTFALRGAGISLFEASPQLFQKVFWELVDAGALPRTISIVSEEPTFPWELMVPSRTVPAGDEEREPLGAEFLVSRWTARDHVHPVQRLTLADCYVVAPTDSRLLKAAEEARMVIDSFAPGKGTAIDPAGIVQLDTTLSSAGRSLLHFVCHGKSGGAAGQTLVLQDKEELNSSFLRAMPGVKKAFRAAKPLVFLNACEVGRAEPALVGVGGFAEAFMALGASAVIAPLWSVKDSIAHDIAVEFYERSRREPRTPFAEILRDLRRRSYGPGGGEDSWAAYCFYGDPLATAG